MSAGWRKYPRGSARCVRDCGDAGAHAGCRTARDGVCGALGPSLLATSGRQVHLNAYCSGARRPRRRCSDRRSPSAGGCAFGSEDDVAFVFAGLLSSTTTTARPAAIARPLRSARCQGRLRGRRGGARRNLLTECAGSVRGTVANAVRRCTYLASARSQGSRRRRDPRERREEAGCLQSFRESANLEPWGFAGLRYCGNGQRHPETAMDPFSASRVPGRWASWCVPMPRAQ